MQAKKSLGQNFLHSKSALRTIINASDPTQNDTILEIGPGKGILTKELLAYARKVIAIEKDSRLIQKLQEKFSEQIKTGTLDLIEGDILDFDPKTLSLYKTGYKVVANIPYYITGAIIKKFLSTSCQPETMVLMVQKEVAKRIIARDKKESILSLSVKAYGTPYYIATVKKESFNPKPKVDSAILSIKNISKKFFSNFSEETFFEIVKTSFSSKRKVVRNNLSSLLKESTDAFLLEAQVPQNARPEDISLSSWQLLSKKADDLLRSKPTCPNKKHVSVRGDN